MELFLNCHKPDTILTWETPGDWTFPWIWKKRSVKWVHMVHWDWFSGEAKHSDLWRIAKLLAPNAMCKAELERAYRLPSIHLPVPVDTKRLAFRERAVAETFISIYGYGGMQNRRSLHEIMEAWKLIPQPPRLVILAQKQPDELVGGKVAVPKGIEVKLCNLPEPADLYTAGDVALQPSRYEGVGVSLVEAQSCGLPVIAVDAPPMSEVAPDLKVQVAKVAHVSLMGKTVPSYIPAASSIASVVSGIKNKDIKELSRRARDRAETQFSWNALRQRWVQTLSG
jgi:glycosyltransferase involved in cell wall biosynthesis